MPTFTLSTIAQASGHPFVALPGSSGKLSNAAERQADALNSLSRAALPGVALVEEFQGVTMVEIFSFMGAQAS